MNFLGFSFGKKKTNKYNDAIFQLWGGGEAQYDYNKINYIEQGYNINPFVYSVTQAIATKFSSIPFEVCEIEDEESMKQYSKIVNQTNYNLTPIQKLKVESLRNKAYGEIKSFHLDKPNPINSWIEFRQLFEIYLKTVGEVFIYKLAPEEGSMKGQPIAFYILPAHYIEIVVKDGYKMEDLDSPVKEYLLIEGNEYVSFKKEEVIHIKYANPNYDLQGTNLYGNSPLRAVWKNVVSSNEALGLNIKTMKNGGAFGLIHSKGNTALTEEQAKALKERLKQMDSGSGRLDKIAGISAEIGFTPLSLKTSELQPFEFLQFDEKQICNALGWDAKLLNNDAGAKYDNYKSAQKRVLIDTIVPDLNIFKNMFNEVILPMYGDMYKGYKVEYNLNDLPEMQEDMSKLVEWVDKSVRGGIITRNQARKIMGLEESENPLMDEITTVDDLLTLEQSLDDFPAV